MSDKLVSHTCVILIRWWAMQMAVTKITAVIIGKDWVRNGGKRGKQVQYLLRFEDFGECNDEWVSEHIIRCGRLHCWSHAHGYLFIVRFWAWCKHVHANLCPRYFVQTRF